MRVVLDTNILFSALISPHGKPDVIYRAWRSARFEIVTSQLQLDENEPGLLPHPGFALKYCDLDRH